jgi:hypothetical protein
VIEVVGANLSFRVLWDLNARNIYYFIGGKFTYVKHK